MILIMLKKAYSWNVYLKGVVDKAMGSKLSGFSKEKRMNMKELAKAKHPNNKNGIMFGTGHDDYDPYKGDAIKYYNPKNYHHLLPKKD